jgi:hypothetical protein
MRTVSGELEGVLGPFLKYCPVSAFLTLSGLFHHTAPEMSAWRTLFCLVIATRGP